MIAFFLNVDTFSSTFFCIYNVALAHLTEIEK